MQLEFVEAMDADKVIPLATLDKGFTDPETISLAYFQASLVVDHIVRRFGEAKLRALLVAYGEGLDTPSAVARALGEGLESLQESFTAGIQADFAALRQALAPPPDGQMAGVVAAEELAQLAAEYPGSYPVQVALGQALEESGDTKGAMAAYERAAALVPWATGDDAPQARLARLAAASGDRARAAEALEQLIAVDHDNVDAARELAALVDDPASPRGVAALQRVADLDPFDSAATGALGRRALAAGDPSAGARWLRMSLAAGPKDVVAAHCDLADAYRRLGDPGRAKREVLLALEIAPTFPRAQDLLLAVVEAHP
jgi:tetratricopeptide (TPR) repeat protein